VPDEEAIVSYGIHRDARWLKFVRRANRFAQRLTYSDEELLVSLSNSLKMRELEIEEQGSLQGKLMTFFVGKDSGDTIEIDGVRLKRLVELTGLGPREDVDIDQVYAVKLAAFRELLDKARQSVATADPQNDA
jgi:hypothetical protein